MLVRVDISPSVQQRAGVGRYVEELVRNLVDISDGVDVRLFYADSTGRSPVSPLDCLPQTTLRWDNKPWRLSALLSQYARVPMDSLVGDADIFHATDHLLPRLNGMRSVFTLHDLSFLTCPETHLPSNRWFLRVAVPVFLRRADAVICISDHTKRDAVRYYGLDDPKVFVVPEGVDERFGPVSDEQTAAVRARYSLPESFILFVGTIEPRKNLVTLLDAFHALRSEGRPERLVIVGRKGWLHEATFARVRELGLESEVLFLGYVADEDLPALFGAASVFAFPSLYEGFGLPPLEAMSCGTPVVCSDSSSLPEVCGDSAILVPPRDARALANALRRVLEDPALRGDLRERGIKQAAKFTWRQAAASTAEVYRTVVESADAAATRRVPRSVARR